MWVFIDRNAHDGFWVGSFAGDPFDLCRDYVRSKLGMAPWRPGFASDAKPQRARPVQRIVNTADHSQRALQIWSESQAIAGTIAEKYLARRIRKCIPWPADLAFHPRCGRKMDQSLEYHPALLVLLRDIASNKPCSIQRIFLAPDGTDRLRDKMGKATLGSSYRAVCKLSSDNSVTHGLALCEGVENSLALMAIGLAPVWCSLGTSGMSNFGPLPGIESLTIFADNDEAGQEAAKKCGMQWSYAGKHVRMVTPKDEAADWDDLARGAA